MQELTRQLDRESKVENSNVVKSEMKLIILIIISDTQGIFSIK